MGNKFLSATFSLAAASLCLFGTGLVRAEDAVPPLDDTIVERYTELVEWLIDVQFSPLQKSELRATVKGYWQNNNRKNINSVINSLGMWQKLHDADEDLRVTTIRLTRPDVLISLQKEMRKGARDDAWLYNAFLKAHPPLAPGKPNSVPLTKDMVDAALDMEYFMQHEVLNKPMPQPTDQTRQVAYQQAARTYNTLSEAQQIDLAKKAGQLSLERGKWNRMGPQLRALTRAQMGGNLTPEDAYLVQEFQNMGSNFQSQMLGNEMANWQQNSDIIMGRGTTWNPALGRWEQHGGIVTEFDSGVVRTP